MTDIGQGRGEPKGPFGNPDGARADIGEVLDGFVDVRAFGALSTAASDASARVLVGKLGAGKTVYMRRLHSYQAANEGVYADHPRQDLPSTDLIVQVCQWYRINQLTAKWSKIWQRGILR